MLIVARMAHQLILTNARCTALPLHSEATSLQVPYSSHQKNGFNQIDQLTFETTPRITNVLILNYVTFIIYKLILDHNFFFPSNFGFDMNFELRNSLENPQNHADWDFLRRASLRVGLWLAPPWDAYPFYPSIFILPWW